ncbi:hypothetical protein [Lutibaculum baratangense]|uniref:Uncharacterized protein n=1 Tax=Lutibaculum baratangense AMV1 TaxID=631454 RepID=V4RBC8_9HYPH|nr:hypothetical protein [Lutibaculum baratangense]ESR22709.1 hypothetical protein N177_3846 [Lutibaculum baratangense AMV1]
MAPSDRTVETLSTRKHVLAVGKGENAWLMSLERFLKANKGELHARLLTDTR